MGVISKGGIRGGGGGGERKGPVVLASTVIDITTICRKTGVPENPLPDTPET